MINKVLGIGKRRIVVSNGNGTCLKIPVNFNGKYANYYEWENYNNLSEEDKRYACPLFSYENGLITAKELSPIYTFTMYATMKDYINVFSQLFPKYANEQYINKLLSRKVATNLSVGGDETGMPLVFDLEDQHDWYLKVGHLDIREQLGDTLTSVVNCEVEKTWLIDAVKYELFPLYFDEVIDNKLDGVPEDFITWYYKRQGKTVVSFETELQKSTMVKLSGSLEQEIIIITPMGSPE